MAIDPKTLLLSSLQAASKAINKNLIKSDQLTRTDRERLLKNGWLLPIIKGWYILKKPTIDIGESTTWYATYWDFISVYLQDRFAEKYCLSADSSLDLLLGDTVRPESLLIMTQTGGASVINLPYNSTLVVYIEKNNFPAEVTISNDIRVMPLALALCRISPLFFRNSPQKAEIALRMIRDATELSRHLLKGGYVAAAERLVGAYRFLGLNNIADTIFSSMTSAGYKLAAKNPFVIKHPILASGLLIRSPYAARITSLWQTMRKTVIDVFPAAKGLPKNKQQYLTSVKEQFVNDAYNSLSIEGYQVTEELIKQITDDKWNPQQSASDKEQYNALAAKGYWQAFQTVLKSIEKIFTKQNPGQIVKQDLILWYQELFAPMIQAGILSRENLAGYRNHPVYIRGSQHVPLPQEAIIDAMEAFYECLTTEPEVCVKAVLGHFILGFIHPFMDGNGRIARFLMNVMFAAGGHPWTIIALENRQQYMQALELASVKHNIKPFAQFVCQSQPIPIQ